MELVQSKISDYHIEENFATKRPGILTHRIKNSNGLHNRRGCVPNKAGPSPTYSLGRL